MWSDYSLADTLPREKESSSIELLIGNDFYLDFILPQRVDLQPGLYMLTTKLGWMLSGRVSGMTRNNQNEDIPEPNMLVMTYGLGVQTETNLFTNTATSKIFGNWKQLAYMIHHFTIKTTGSSDLFTKH